MGSKLLSLCSYNEYMVILQLWERVWAKKRGSYDFDNIGGRGRYVQHIPRLMPALQQLSCPRPNAPDLPLPVPQLIRPPVHPWFGLRVHERMPGKATGEVGKPA